MALDDIVKNAANLGNNNNTPNSEILKHLNSIDASLKSIASNPNKFSQSFAQDRQKESSNVFKNMYNTSNKARSASKGFLDSFEDELMEGLLGSNFKKDVSKIFDDFAKQLGTDVQSLSGTIGKEIAKQGLSAFKQTQMGANTLNAISGLKAKGLSFATSKLQNSASFINNGGIAKAGAALSKMSLSLPHLAAAIGLTTVAFAGLKAIVGGVGGIFKGVGMLFKGAMVAANRTQATREQNLKLAQARLMADVETMMKKPFEILEKAANTIYGQWDNNLRTINGTQGYTKSNLQDLMSAFASRLREEGLSSVIAGTDITQGLTQVLKAGLSGKIAEEFAYQATKMNAALPTQDFFGYASTYASIVANQVKLGKTQEEAMKSANETLSEFASGLLYASRTLNGGMTTGLTNAQSIYDTATRIAQTAKSSNISEIAGVLLSTQGTLGAVSPDLANGVVDTITKLLIGGNSNDVVALRSLAGINASNTEFLQAFAKNPKQIMSTLFNNLNKMFTSHGEGAYMEKAEGYAQLFGMSTDAFARINFKDVADAISNMSMSQASLQENMKLLASGQTTTSAEQLNMQQVNKYMIEKGLSHVLDNEAGREIQRHMWQEQMQRELMQATFSVNLVGSTAEAIETIKNKIANVVNLLNPFAWFKKIGNILNTTSEATGHENDIKRLLEVGKVGQGNAKQLYQLTTRNTNLGVAPHLLEMMGSFSGYKMINRSQRQWEILSNPFLEGFDSKSDLLGGLSNINGPLSPNDISSQYSFGKTKSGARVLQSLLKKASKPALATVKTLSGTSAKSSSAVRTNSIIQKMLSEEYLNEKFIKQGKTYEDWAQSAASFGISDFNSALADAGYGQAQVKAHFEAKETERGAQSLHEIRQHEQLYRETGIAFWNDKFPTQFKDPLFNLINQTNQKLQDIIGRQDKFEKIFKSDWIEKGWGSYVSLGNGSSGLFNRYYNEFMKYFVNHTYYSNTKGYKFEDVTKIQNDYRKQENGAVVTELANVLTNNLVDLADPQMQTNALLSQILIITKAIMNQGNQVAGTNGHSALLESLSAMALGMTTNGG